MDYVKTLDTRREFIANTAPSDCKLDEKEAQTTVLVMLWSSDATNVQPEWTTQTINEQIKKYKNSDTLNTNLGLTGYPILMLFLVPPSIDTRKGLQQVDLSLIP